MYAPKRSGSRPRREGKSAAWASVRQCPPTTARRVRYLRGVADASWRFADSPDLGVIVTRAVYTGETLLTCVSHDPDGDWQFLDDGEDNDPPREVSDAIGVHLSHVVERFPEVEELFDLPMGWIAWRDAKKQSWTREPRPPDWAVWE